MPIDHVKAHFEEEAQIFDALIQKIVPNYNEMIDALVSVIPFPRESKLSVADLGCGTGTVAKAVRNVFPNITITCVDIAGSMLEIARQKLGPDVKCIQADLNKYEFDESHDLIVSSLALHHLENDEDKMRLYEKIYSALRPNGMFVNIDIVLGGNGTLQNEYMMKWRRFMEKGLPEKDIEEQWLPTYYAEDRPAKLITHLDMLKECGFSVIDVVYKYYNFAVYCAQK
ncbi:MAG: class I SAM-dependent methyltransferase [Methanomassiliicoccaceae archaeon]|jgi:tRNA (cmo5U34)-methyltransferase|nr:class I SAM-dependent methyltransferase [Methanomassiliicoccaceae archaeon]